MPYAADSIFVQRVVPVPTRCVPLAEASANGWFSLVGTGGEDYACVQCRPGEVWSLDVMNPVALISAQNDVAEGMDAYSAAPIADQLSRMDRVQNDLRSFIPQDSLFFSVYTLFRREASWRLPSERNPEGVVGDRIKALCNLLFQDPRSRHMWRWFSTHARHYTECVILANLQRTAARFDFSPTKDSMIALTRAISAQQNSSEAFAACIESALSRAHGPSLADTVPHFVGEFQQAVSDGEILLARTAANPGEEAKAMEYLYAQVGLDRPAGTEFPESLGKPFFLDAQTLSKYNPAMFVHRFCSFYLRDRNEFIDELYELMREKMPIR